MKRIYILAHLNTDRVFECKTQKESEVLQKSLQWQGWRILDVKEQERVLPKIEIYIYLDWGGYLVETNWDWKQAHFDNLRKLRRALVKNGVSIPLVRTFKRELENEGRAYLTGVPYDPELDIEHLVG